jgi:radical SAM superfamily enzyme YgiQ (UPF0313 family)
MTRPVPQQTRRGLLLVAPPILHGAGWWANRIANKPHLHSLAGYVRDLARVRVLELDLTAEHENADEDELLDGLDELLTDAVRLVGVSCWTSLHYLGALAVVERVRQLAPDVPVVVGGHHPTAVPEDFDGVCDWVVRGDGETVLRELCEEWPARPSQTQVVTGKPFDQSDPAHIDWHRYGRPDAREPALWVAMSRGCPFRCSFCVEPGRGPISSGYEVDDALAILEGLVETHSPRVIAFSDPLFGTRRRWTDDFLAGIEQRRLPIRFWAQTRADLMTPELLERFRRCNFLLDFGLDTGSKTMVERMRKATAPDAYLAKSKAVLTEANTIGLHHGIYLIFNAPGETPATVRETQAFIEGLEPMRGPMSGWLSSQPYFIVPGTEDYARMDEYARTWGTEIRHPRWWTERGDHHALATDVLPSACWKGREAELGAFASWQEGVTARWTARYPLRVRQLRYELYAG